MKQEYSGLLLEIYRATREAPLGAFEDRVLELVKPALQFEKSMWGTGAITPLGLDVHNVHVHEEPEEMMIDYEEVKHQDAVVPEVFKHRGHAVNFQSATFYKGRKRQGMLGFLKRFEHQNVLIATNQGDGNYCQWISLYRANPDWHYSEQERLLCEALSPHLMEALTIHRAIHLDRVGIENRHYARGFSDRKGLLQFAEPNLTNLFHLEWPDWNEVLLPTPLLDAFVTANGTRYRGRHIVVRALRQEGLLFLGTRKRAAADELSERELQVARHIAAGLSHKEIARLINVAPATARNHTQSIYGKLQVSNKAKLIAELSMIAED